MIQTFLKTIQEEAFAQLLNLSVYIPESVIEYDNTAFYGCVSLENIKVGLEATGHYSNNILNFLTSKGFNVYVINPLQTNLYRKGQSLRKTKTDKLDAHVIATMLVSDNLKPYIPVSYHISELKSLTRHRFRLVKENSKFETCYPFSALETLL